jgi:hypothetical protein
MPIYMENKNWSQTGLLDQQPNIDAAASAYYYLANIYIFYIKKTLSIVI